MKFIKLDIRLKSGYFIAPRGNLAPTAVILARPGYEIRYDALKPYLRFE